MSRLDQQGGALDDRRRRRDKWVRVLGIEGFRNGRHGLVGLAGFGGIRGGIGMGRCRRRFRNERLRLDGLVLIHV